MQYLLYIIVLLSIVSCRTSRQIEIVPAASHDTIFVNHELYDSIYVSQSHDQAYHRDLSATQHLVDTLYIRDVATQYKYKFLHDTTYIHRTDSIPVIKTVEVTRTEKYIPAIYRGSLGICITLVLALILWLVIKIKRHTMI